MTFTAAQEAAARTEIVRVGQLLYQKGYIVSNDGNISVRLDENHVLCTPSGLCKGMMRQEELLIIDMDGNRADTPNAINRNLRPTSEMAMHLEVYKNRPDVGAVVHCHPPTAVALSIANVSLTDCMLPEVIVTLGLIKMTPYSTPSSEENATAIRDAIKTHDAILLQRHGTLAVGNSPMQAFHRTESIEQIAKITFMAKLMGGGEPLPPHQVEKLLAQRAALGLAHGESEAAEFCEICGATHPQGTACPVTFPAEKPASSGTVDDALVAEITRRVLEKLHQSR
ncbi:MAG TPA: class II aldolase/adducin family protein [Anaerolineae bacterium]|nr:class II aldolase/adducin family protein [Anaerolineae bacterium]